MDWNFSINILRLADPINPIYVMVLPLLKKRRLLFTVYCHLWFGFLLHILVVVGSYYHISQPGRCWRPFLFAKINFCDNGNTARSNFNWLSWTG